MIEAQQDVEFSRTVTEEDNMTIADEVTDEIFDTTHEGEFYDTQPSEISSDPLSEEGSSSNYALIFLIGIGVAFILLNSKR